MAVIDLRSDTVTLPTPEMRRAMAEARLGDDVMREDPTVNRLEELAASRVGKEAGLLVSSGTMGNLVGLLVNAPRAHEVIVEADAHTFVHEAAGAAAAGGIQLRQVQTERGVFSPEQVEAAIRPRDDEHQPLSAAVCVENTHNRHGGVVWPLDDLHAVAEVAHSHGLSVHLDGARLFNAAVALGVDVHEITREVDTLTFCLSKGLSAPVGSVFCGPADKVAEARRWRKMLGGGMRQAGIIAAAGIVALETMVDRLAEDQSNARTLAEGLAEMDGVSCDLSRVQTNLVYFSLDAIPAGAFVAECANRGVLAFDIDRSTVRFVTHYGIDAQDIQQALSVCQDVLAAA